MGAWGRFPTPARQARKGDTTTYGVGTVKKIWPASEQTVAYEPYTHFGYIALRGSPSAATAPTSTWRTAGTRRTAGRAP